MSAIAVTCLGIFVNQWLALALASICFIRQSRKQQGKQAPALLEYIDASMDKVR
jgi:hypothetical protein